MLSRFPLAWLSFLCLVSARPADSSNNPAKSVVYVQTFKTTSGGKLSLLPLVQQKSGATHIYLAAVHINEDPNDIHLNDNSPEDPMFDSVWSDAATLQQQGIKVMFMLGGAAPGSYPRLCGGANGAINETYYKPLRDTIQRHKIDGIDLDIEEDVPVTCPLQLLQHFYQDFGKNFILTMAPVASELQESGIGLGGFDYKDLESKAIASDKPNGKLVNWFNAQFYNGWGDAKFPNDYNAIIQNGFTADRVVLGVLDAQNDGGSGWYDLATYSNTIKTLKANYDNFAGTIGWEYWDAGTSESPALSDPWMWVQKITNAIFSTTTAKENDMFAVLDAPSPWPRLTKDLLNLAQSMNKDVPYLAAIKALNQTHGNLNAAKKRLGLH